MDSLELLKQAKSLMAQYAESQSAVEDLVANSLDEEMMLAGIIKYMQILGKKDPEKMASAKELVQELDAFAK